MTDNQPHIADLINDLFQLWQRIGHKRETILPDLNIIREAEALELLGETVDLLEIALANLHNIAIDLPEEHQ